MEGEPKPLSEAQLTVRMSTAPGRGSPGPRLEDAVLQSRELCEALQEVFLLLRPQATAIQMPDSTPYC